MKHFHRIPLEVVCVECDDRANSVYVHRSNQPRIVHLHSRDLICRDEALPFREDVRAFRKELEECFALAQSSLRGCHVHAKTVDSNRPRSHTPEFNKVLCANAQNLASPVQNPKRVAGNTAQVDILALDGSKQYVGIHQIRGHRYQ